MFSPNTVHSGGTRRPTGHRSLNVTFVLLTGKVGDPGPGSPLKGGHFRPPWQTSVVLRIIHRRKGGIRSRRETRVRGCSAVVSATSQDERHTARAGPPPAHRSEPGTAP